MTTNLDLINLENVSKSFRDEETICSRQLVTKFSRLKNRGAQLLHSVKCKFDGVFAADKEIFDDQRTDIQDVNHPVTRPKLCFCNKPSSQWRSRINDIGSMTRSVLGKKPDPGIARPPNIQDIKNQSGTLSPQTESPTAIKESIFLRDSEQNPEKLTSFLKDGENQSRSSSRQSENALAVEDTNFLNDPERNTEKLSSRNSKGIHNQSRLSSLQTENTGAAGIEEFNPLSDPDRTSERSSRILKVIGIIPEPAKLENDASSRTPERRQSLEEERKSSIRSQRTSLPLSVEPMKPIAEIETQTASPKIQEINDRSIEPLAVISEERKELERASILSKGVAENVEEVPPIVDFEAVIKKEQPLEFEIVNISRKEFDNLERDKDVRKLIRIDHKKLPPDEEHLSVLPAYQIDSHNEWRGIPGPVIDEIRRVTKPKRPHECSRACPCKFSQELINIYHEAKHLSKVANRISQDRDHCKFRMTSSEINFFKEDTKMCNVMIGETQSRRAEMRELMDMWQEANEKLTVQKKEIFAIDESVDGRSKRIFEIENLLKDWLPGGRMEKLRKKQRAIEKEEQEKMYLLEDEERSFCKKKIEQLVQKREAWLADEEFREEKRKNQRQKDSLALQNATNIMQKYIDERKSLLIQ